MNNISFSIKILTNVLHSNKNALLRFRIEHSDVFEHMALRWPLVNLTRCSISKSAGLIVSSLPPVFTNTPYKLEHAWLLPYNANWWQSKRIISKAYFEIKDDHQYFKYS